MDTILLKSPDKNKKKRAPKKNATMPSARGAAFAVLMRVESSDAYADSLLNAELSGFHPQEASLATELTYGVLRWKIKIDWIIDCFAKIKTQKMEHSVLTALRLGVYQLLFLKGIPPHAAVSESVNLVKPYGEQKASFVNAVLRAAEASRGNVAFPVLSKEPVKYISIVFSHPQWLIERWIERYGVKEAMEICQANLRTPPTILRANTLLNNASELCLALRAEGMTVKKTEYSGMGVEVLDKGDARINPQDGRFYIQDEASQLVAYLVAPRPGESVCDACSAPGGKTAELAQMMENKGLIVAMDKNSTRLKNVEAVAKRFDIDIIKTVAGDAASLELQPSLLSGRTLHVPKEGFDAVLVDAPCSGLGVLRRTPEIKYRRSVESIKASAEEQLKILLGMSRHVKPGGRLVYSVCSFEPEETSGVVSKFLESNDDFVWANANDYLPSSCEGLVSGGELVTLPHRHGMDGFFAARFGRRKLS